MEIYVNIPGIVQRIDILTTENKLQLISVDGFSGSGKSFLSKKIAENNNYKYIDIDKDYLTPNDGLFINFVKYEKLKADISKFVSDGKRVVIDGICILKVLDRIGFKPDIKVYVKRIHSQQWRDGKYLNYSTNVEDALSAERNELQEFENDAAYIEGREPKIIDSSREDMTHETFRYHYLYHPDIVSDLVFHRIM
jgi:adenylate kinase family enzyme